MLQALIIQIMLVVGCILFLVTQLFAKFNKDRMVKAQSQQKSTNEESTKGQYRIISRIGNIAGSLLFIFVIINIFLFNFVSEYIPHLDLDDLTMPIQLIAFACTLVGCGIMFPAYKMLGANWIDSVQADGQFPIPAAHQLVQTGIYKHMRNPIYLATLLVFGGFAFLTLDPIIIAAFVIHSIGVYFQVRDEEKALFEHFGDVYTQYLKKTGRFLPKWNNA